MPQAIQHYTGPNAVQQAKIIILTTALQQQQAFLEAVKAAYPDTDAVEDQQAAIWNALVEVGAVQ